MAISRQRPKAVAIFLLAAIFLPLNVLADRDGSLQEEYYLKNFRNNPNRNKEFMFIRNDKKSIRKGGASAVDIVPHNPYGDREDYSIPNFLLFVPLVGAWMAALVLVRNVSPRIVSSVCRQISEFTRTWSERTEAMHERNRQSNSNMKRRVHPPPKRSQRIGEIDASDNSISITPSILELTNMASDNEDDGPRFFGHSMFSTLTRAKTVIASNSNHVQQDRSPSRGAYSKHDKHAPPRMRRSNDNDRSHHKQHHEHDKNEREYKRHGDKKVLHHSEHRAYNNHDQTDHVYRETPYEGYSGQKSGHVKLHAPSSNKHSAHNMSPLEKKLSSGSHGRIK